MGVEGKKLQHGKCGRVYGTVEYFQCPFCNGFEESRYPKKQVKKQVTVKTAKKKRSRGKA